MVEKGMYFKFKEDKGNNIYKVGGIKYVRNCNDECAVGINSIYNRRYVPHIKINLLEGLIEEGIILCMDEDEIDKNQFHADINFNTNIIIEEYEANCNRCKICKNYTNNCNDINNKANRICKNFLIKEEKVIKGFEFSFNDDSTNNIFKVNLVDGKEVLIAKEIKSIYNSQKLRDINIDDINNLIDLGFIKEISKQQEIKNKCDLNVKINYEILLEYYFKKIKENNEKCIICEFYNNNDCPIMNEYENTKCPSYKINKKFVVKYREHSFYKFTYVKITNDYTNDIFEVERNGDYSSSLLNIKSIYSKFTKSIDLKEFKEDLKKNLIYIIGVNELITNNFLKDKVSLSKSIYVSQKSFSDIQLFKYRECNNTIYLYSKDEKEIYLVNEYSLAKQKYINVDKLEKYLNIEFIDKDSVENMDKKHVCKCTNHNIMDNYMREYIGECNLNEPKYRTIKNGPLGILKVIVKEEHVPDMWEYKSKNVYYYVDHKGREYNYSIEGLYNFFTSNNYYPENLSELFKIENNLIKTMITKEDNETKSPTRSRLKRQKLL